MADQQDVTSPDDLKNPLLHKSNMKNQPGQISTLTPDPPISAPANANPSVPMLKTPLSGVGPEIQTSPSDAEPSVDLMQTSLQDDNPSISSMAKSKRPVTGAPGDKHEGGYERALVMGGHIITVATAVLATNCKSAMSENATGLFYFLVGSIFISLLSHFYALCFSEFRKTAGILRIITIFATGLGLVAATGLHMPDDKVFKVMVVALCFSCPALCGYAIKTVFPQIDIARWLWDRLRQVYHRYFGRQIQAG